MNFEEMQILKTAIIYESTHHGNTKKLIQAISDKHGVVLIDVNSAAAADLEQYDVIGLASGIAFGKFYEKITEFAKNSLPNGKKVFFIYTCGRNSKNFSQNIKGIAESRGCVSLGSYGCKGYDTYGPFKLVGGINKQNPNIDEINGAVEFFEKIMQ